MSNEETEEYEFVRAIIEGGSLRWEYEVNGSDRMGRQTHDEDVSEWDDDDIRQLSRAILGLTEDEMKRLEILYH